MADSNQLKNTLLQIVDKAMTLKPKTESQAELTTELRARSGYSCKEVFPKVSPMQWYLIQEILHINMDNSEVINE